jgi:hypothetical protein
MTEAEHVASMVDALLSADEIARTHLLWILEELQEGPCGEQLSSVQLVKRIQKLCTFSQADEWKGNAPRFLHANAIVHALRDVRSANDTPRDDTFTEAREERAQGRDHARWERIHGPRMPVTTLKRNVG